MAARTALVIGLGQYKTPYRLLKFCPPSATDVFRLLISNDFGQCSPSKSVLLTDTQDCITNTEIYNSIDTILSTLIPKDMFIFYFCGHGDLVENKLFLMTNSSQRAQDGFSLSILMERLGNYNLANTIIVIDACFSQSMFNAIKDWGQTNLPDNCGLMASAGHFQYAEADLTIKKSRFSHFFCEGIQNGCAETAPTSSTFITLEMMKEYITKQLLIRYGNDTQDIHLLSIGDINKLWIAKRNDQNLTYIPPKPLINLDMILQVFQKTSVSPKECDEALHQLKGIRERLDVAIEKIDARYRIRGKIDDLIKKIEKHRNSGRKDASKTTEREAILRDLQLLISEYNKSRSAHWI
jgi:hypothetical protein